MGWSETDIPDLTGKTALITGANSGIGLEAARAMAQHGAEVLIACRSPERGQGALETLKAAAPDANIRLLKLDLADLASVRALPEQLGDTQLDWLINNAGVMAIPRRETADGFEMQLGTNHLGHFALTGLLLERLKPGARIVHVASNAHKTGKMKWDDLQHTQRYERWTVYFQSKLANLLFMYELDRRLTAAGFPAISLACHPGYSSTKLLYRGSELDGMNWLRPLWSTANALLAQTAQQGALPTLFAAVDPSARSADYIGPGGLLEMWGAPIHVKSKAKAQNAEDAKRLWDVSVELTGVGYETLAP